MIRLDTNSVENFIESFWNECDNDILLKKLKK